MNRHERRAMAVKVDRCMKDSRPLFDVAIGLVCLAHFRRRYVRDRAVARELAEVRASIDARLRELGRDLGG